MHIILVVGNGSIGQSLDNVFYTNKHTGEFLQKIGLLKKICYLEYCSTFSVDSNILSFELNNINIDIVPILSLRKSFSFVKIIKSILNCSFVYIFFPGTLGRFGALLSILIGKKFGLYVRGQFYKKYWLDKFILRNASFVLCVSKSFSLDIKNYCADVSLIRPMLNLNLLDMNHTRNFSTPRIWNLLYVGRVEFRKGLDELIDISFILKRYNFPFHLHIIGGGEMLEFYQKRASQLSLLDCVFFNGNISNNSDLHSFYYNADAFIFASHDEGFPRVLYEAMAFSLPIFTTFVGGISGVMVDQVNCIKIPVKDSKLAAEVILRNLANISFLINIGLGGRTTFTQLVNSDLLSHEDLFINKIDFYL